ncbi:BPM2 [Symbiodinium sp. CCMP2456]|nr:BPM2 [Symbiodinium sp. CCMP2456]
MTWDSCEPASCLPPDALMRPFLRPTSQDAACVSQLRVFRWTLVSYNALSLLPGEIAGDSLPEGRGPGLYGATGRVALLSQTLQARRVFIAGIQEARTPAGTCNGPAFTRYCSGANTRNCYGVELWVANGQGWPRHQVTVLHSDVCRLVARLEADSVALTILVGHAPHRAQPEDVRTDWWRTTSRLCSQVINPGGWVFLLDANCRIGSVTSPFVDSHQPDLEDISGSHLHELLHTVHSWLPATFACCMSGPGGTLLQRSSGGLQRCDFIAVPWAWAACETQAWVDPGITAGHATADHFAAVVCCTFRHGKPKRNKQLRIDPAALRNPGNARKIEAILGRVPELPWSLNVNDHAAVLSDYLFVELAKAFPLSAKRLRGSFFSEDTAAVHAQIARLRHALRDRLAAQRLSYLRCAFVSWRERESEFGALLAGKWSATLQTVIALIGRQIGLLGRDLRKRCRADKRVYLECLAKDVDHARPGDMQIALKRLLRPRKFRRGGPLPLPFLKRPDGNVCQSFEQVQEEWRRHFAELEGGVCVEVASFASQCLSRQASTPARESLCCASIPSIVALRDAFREVSAMKATGPDGLPPALCARFPTPLATVFWPVLLKTLCYGSEPVGYKGGTLFHILKPGSKDRGLCSSERGILVQSSLEKVLHKVLRPVATAELDRRALPLQIGGRAGLSHGIGFYCTRLFLDFAQQRNLSAGILFCDLAAAYYAIVRETLTGIDADSCSIADIAGSLGLTHADLQALQYHSSCDPVLSDARCGELLSSLAKEFHTDSWFILQQDHRVVHTRRGTRPGSSWADVVFSLLFARVLARRGDFSEQGLQPVIPWSGSRRPVAYDARRAGQAISVVQDVIYADDLATCLVAPSALSLSQAARHVAGVSVDTLLSHGLRPNIGPKKTSVLLAPRGPGARDARESVFARAKGRLPVLCENVGTIMLDVVPQYRHLGSVLTFNGSMIPEAKARVQHAKQLFKEGRATVFCTPHIALDKRVALFRSHVLSAMLSGCGAWPCLCRSSWKVLESCYFTMLRAMLRIPLAAAQNWTTERVLARVGLPNLFGLVSADRLRFLAQLVRKGPDAVFALLQHSPRALEAFRSAAEWFVAACSSTTCLRALADTWDEWVAVFSTPRRFKGLLKRATTWHVGATESLATFQCFCRQHWSPAPVAPLSVEVATHACLLCSIAFYDFHSWSAHAARSHGYRSRSRRFAQGLTCRACGVKFATLRRHQRHLIDSVRCCQAVERDLPTLFPVDHSEPGHVQSVSSGGGDFTFVPVAGPDISAALLRALREGHFESDTAIFDCIKAAIEPFHVLRSTLSLWISELGEGQLADWASDVLLCLQVDLLCDSASRTRRDTAAPEEFTPLLRGFPVADGWAEFPFLTDRAHWTSDFAFIAGSQPEIQRVQFWRAPPSGTSFAGLSLDVPESCLLASLAWAIPTCPQRDIRSHTRWLRLLLSWLGFAIALAELGRILRPLEICDSTAVRICGKDPKAWELGFVMSSLRLAASSVSSFKGRGELRAAIEDERRRAEAEEARLPELEAETEQARERERLRRQLRDVIARRMDAQRRNAEEIYCREDIDDAVVISGAARPPRKQCAIQASGGESTNYRDKNSTGEHVWRIEGFSWVPCALEQHGAVLGWTPHFVHSSFELGNVRFFFRYSPWASYICEECKGSLAIALYIEHDECDCIALRYRIYVKARSGEFVQWGETYDVVHHDGHHYAAWRAYGPDVHWPGHPPASLGIFGLSHEELLQSEWVVDDTLTVKFELEVRPDQCATRQPLSLAAEIPEPTILKDTQALLEEGIGSDVRFMVQDEVIQAHSQVLCARSEVFRKQLTAGMQESLSRVIVIEDCDVGTFKTFLHFLYTDRFPEVKDFIPVGTSSNSEAEHGSPKVSLVQSLFSVSNKYQVMRLQLWCEATLSHEISIEQVCGILCQAHLLQAKQLEKACLSFIKDHATQVLTLPAYADLVKKWPQIGLKVHLYTAGVSEAEALAAIDALEKPPEQQSEPATE